MAEQHKRDAAIAIAGPRGPSTRDGSTESSSGVEPWCCLR